MNQIVVNYNTREKRFAILEKDKVTKINIQQPTDQSKLGNIYLGKVEAVKVGMNAAFVDIGDGKKGFLHRDQLPMYVQSKDPSKESMAISRFLKEGQRIIVQVKKDESDLKGPLLTALIEFSGERMIYMPEGEYMAVSKKLDQPLREKWSEIAQRYKENHEGFIVRTEAATASEEQWLEELQQLRSEYENILQIEKTAKSPSLIWARPVFLEEILHEIARLEAGTIIADDPVILKTLQKKVKNIPGWQFVFHQHQNNIFSSYHLEEEVENALKKIVWLKNGAYLVVEETEALTVIDVNTGKFTGNQNLQDTVLKTNLLAAQEIGRQLSIRDYGGMILVDFIDMKNESYRQKVKQALQNELHKDTKYSRIVGFTELGILQITRKKPKSHYHKHYI